MDTATLIQIIEAIVAVAVGLGLTVVGKLYIDTKKLIEMIQNFLTSAEEAKKDGTLTKEEIDALIDELTALAKQGNLVVDDVRELYIKLKEMLAAKQLAKQTAKK
jgi:hypothetical protein